VGAKVERTRAAAHDFRGMLRHNAELAELPTEKIKQIRDGLQREIVRQDTHVFSLLLQLLCVSGI